VAVSARFFQSKIFIDMVPSAARVLSPLELVKLEDHAAINVVLKMKRKIS
jgi:hypothetical protein